MAPLDDLIHSILVAFKESLNPTIPSIFDPPLHTYLVSLVLSVVSKEDSLNPSFDNHMSPYLFHGIIQYRPFLISNFRNSQSLFGSGYAGLGCE